MADEFIKNYHASFPIDLFIDVRNYLFKNLNDNKQLVYDIHTKLYTQQNVELKVQGNWRHLAAAGISTCVLSVCVCV